MNLLSNAVKYTMAGGTVNFITEQLADATQGFSTYRSRERCFRFVRPADATQGEAALPLPPE